MSINIATLSRHPERLGKDTLYELRSLLARYPYYQPARLLLLKNLYLLHDPSCVGLPSISPSASAFST